MDMRTWFVAPGARRGRLVVLVGALALMTSCSQPPGPIPDPSPTGPPAPPSTTPPAPPMTEFAPLAADATKGLGTGANDFDTGLAASGNTVVTSSIVYGNRLAPAFRVSTDAGATWQLGGLSEAGQAATPPDQGDQTTDIAVSTVDGAPRWVALGTSWRQPLTWTSADGRRWDRHVPAADQLGRDDGPVEVAAVPEGFVLVGTDARDRPTAWTSSRRGDLDNRTGCRGRAARPRSTSKGSTVVAVGSSDDAYATWTSQDRGRTWTRGSKPPKPADDGDFSRSLDDVTATDDGFTAIGSYSAEEWRPVLYRSKTGSTWQQAPAPPYAKDGTGGTRIRATGSVEVAGTQDYADQGRPRLWFRQGSAWREARTPLRDRSRLDEGEWSLGDLTRSGDAWVAVAQLSRNGQVVSELWRSADGGRTYVAVERPTAELNQPVALPVAVVRSGDETLVLGDSRRRPVVWSRRGAEAFGPAQLVTAQASDRIAGGAAGPKGVLAYGNRSADGTETGVVWRRAGKRWLPTDDGTFSTAGRRYASSSIDQVAWLRNRWFAVGETSDNGDLNSSALVASSPDGQTWTKGRPDRTYTRAGGKVWYDVTDLQGDHDRTRSMNGIAAVGSRLLAVGDSAEGDEDSGKGTAATVWISDDARTWTMRRLPLGGLHWSSMDHVAVRGTTVVVIGTGAASRGGPSRLVVWHSSDGGRTFRQQIMDQALESEDVVTTVSALRSGFAITAERIEDVSRPVVLLSADGASWRELPLTVGVPGPGVGAIVGDADGVGDDLWILVRTTNHAGAGTRLLVQPTR